MITLRFHCPKQGLLMVWHCIALYSWALTQTIPSSFHCCSKRKRYHLSDLRHCSSVHLFHDLLHYWRRGPAEPAGDLITGQRGGEAPTVIIVYDCSCASAHCGRPAAADGGGRCASKSAAEGRSSCSGEGGSCKEKAEAMWLKQFL